MAFLRRFINGLRGYSESGTITLMTTEQQAEWMMRHPKCTRCGQDIDTRFETYDLVQWSDGRRYQSHTMKCPDTPVPSQI